MKLTLRFLSLLLLLAWQLSVHAASVAAQTTAPAPTVAPKTNSLPTISLFPNPARGLVTITVGQKITGEYKLRLSNIIGREVRTVVLRPEAATNGITVNLSDLPAGMYFYSLVLNDKVMSTRRLVLQN
ncbi:T9SS type A sorting domain-containing protein [Hymenobacter weizhouensis]|uniref:T9SS type A sorting domain-containing protein n=1 Tax=Hymenobacter sp. YIM 151500-1 TaxID=2987689 RepID=UPI002227E319|nr:T9SS type A sorting domain-containing protein [Hymenobacter sp. YIM 151500-1]UYZ63067.1 T9SS type A sorting domain-containing protein [Hymenobacter sp. YIM 151500-1]